MGGLESFQPKKRPLSAIEASPLDDYKDNPELHNLLSRLPPELRERHVGAIEDLPDEDASLYLKGILERREVATREANVSEPSAVEYFKKHQEKIWKALETDVFTGKDNILGRGQTARVKRFVLEDEDAPVESMAVKYLVKPTPTTLSVSGEHDLIFEVERLQKIEQAEKQAGLPVESLRVPHPYFFYRHTKTQCYGMEEIKGANLQEIGTIKNTQLREHLKTVLKDIDKGKLIEEAERFFDVMHQICLHGDVKPRNFMISSEGKFYLIDFGQSRVATQIDENAQEAFDNLKDEEKRNAKQILRMFLDRLLKE